ncbi:acyl carrier protein [Streptomyces sp. OZ13]|uniref:acyl carrier protein n=1 Tax=Streptomyces sp. OZ13 TaxID=3452210 RepID=UPI003F8A30E0
MPRSTTDTSVTRPGRDDTPWSHAMPAERDSAPRTAPAAPTDDVVSELVTMLAGVLHLKPEKIDPEQTFRAIGLDSLLVVEFVATLNARYGTAVKAAALFDHPTPLAFARHVARELGMPGQAPASTASASVPPSRTPAAAAPAGPVLDVLREELARILCCDPWDIDTTAAFNLLGVDSILGSEFVAVINRTYGLRERPVTLYDHPSLAALATHISGLLPTTPTPAPPAPVAVAVPDADTAAGQAPSAAEGRTAELGALLDAVRGGRISVDEALGLLSARS